MNPRALFAALLLAPCLAQGQRAIPNGPEGFPVAPTGLEGLPLPAGPFTYKTGEAQDIRVSVLARVP